MDKNTRGQEKDKRLNMPKPESQSKKKMTTMSKETNEGLVLTASADNDEQPRLRSRQPHFGKAPSSQPPLNICCAYITALTVQCPTRPKWMGKQFFIPGATVKHGGYYRFADFFFTGFLIVHSDPDYHYRTYQNILL